jgi:hypothetical protein
MGVGPRTTSLPRRQRSTKLCTLVPSCLPQSMYEGTERERGGWVGGWGVRGSPALILDVSQVFLPHVYQCLGSDQHCTAFFDLECMVALNPSVNGLREEIVIALCTAVMSTYQRLYPDIPATFPLRPVVLHASDAAKFSLHVHFPGFQFQDVGHFEAFMDHLKVPHPFSLQRTYIIYSYF